VKVDVAMKDIFETSTFSSSSPLFEEMLLPDLEHTSVDHDYAAMNQGTSSANRYTHPKETPTKSMSAVSENVDAEEDKADFLLSEAFLKEEKTRNLELTKSSKELEEAIDRHELYIKHLFDPLFSAPKPKVVKIVDKGIYCVFVLLEKYALHIVFLFRCSDSVRYLWKRNSSRLHESTHTYCSL